LCIQYCQCLWVQDRISIVVSYYVKIPNSRQPTSSTRQDIYCSKLLC
jgi:hypothetical protein